jgi:hypothetical protein
MLLSTSTSSLSISSAVSSSPSTPHLTPEDLGAMCARSLLSKISTLGCIDPGLEWMTVLGLVLSGERDVGKVRVSGKVWEGSRGEGLIRFLRDIEKVWGTKVRIEKVVEKWGQSDEESEDEEEIGDVESGIDGEEELEMHDSGEEDGDAGEESDKGDEEGGGEDSSSHEEDGGSESVHFGSSEYPKPSRPRFSREGEEFIFSCLGIGYVNTSKKT